MGLRFRSVCAAKKEWCLPDLDGLAFFIDRHLHVDEQLGRKPHGLI
jgi:hypothetical protein